MKLQMVTRDELLVIMPGSENRIDKFLPFLNQYAERFEVDTTLRFAHFIAQVAHESGELRYVRELASGMKDEGRKDLGNFYPGDGPRYKGRGLLQITGRKNYQVVGEALGLNLLDNPWLLEQPEWAVASAFWFWDRHKLNTWADKDDVVTITKRINGGTNGLADRKKFLLAAKKIFKV